MWVLCCLSLLLVARVVDVIHIVGGFRFQALACEHRLLNYVFLLTRYVYAVGYWLCCTARSVSRQCYSVRTIIICTYCLYVPFMEYVLVHTVRVGTYCT